MLRFHTKKAIVALVANALALSASFAAQTPQKIDVHAGDMVSALQELEKQSDVEFVYHANLLKGIHTNGVSGMLTVLEAVRKLIEGTPLRVEVDAATGAMLIAPPVPTSAAADRTAALRMAMGSEESPAAGAGVRAQEAEKQTFEESNDSHADSASTDLQEIIVTGTHIRGQAPVGTSVVTYTRKDILESGAASLAEFARQMPQNFASVDPAGIFAANPTGFSQTGNDLTRGSGFNLRGIGPAATLTLVDGHRLSPAGADGAFVDISLIPLAAIERIDVLADGASALYGSDAVAGVVNIITRNDLSGAETSLRYGALSRGGGAQRTASQLLGASWSGGNAALTYEYDQKNSLRIDQRSFITSDYRGSYLQPEQDRHSVRAGVHQRLSASTKLLADTYYSRREYETALNNATRSDLYGASEQYGGTLGLKQDLLGDWAAELTANASWLKQPNNLNYRDFDFKVLANTDTRLTSGMLLAGGSLPGWGRRNLQAAVGLEYREDQRVQQEANFSAGELLGEARIPLERSVRSAFAELRVPLLESNGDSKQRLELSIAGRSDHYSDVGSSVNPRFGVSWRPTADLQLHASYGTSFRAPPVNQLSGSTLRYVMELVNPASSTGTTNTLIIDDGNNPTLEPEKADTFTAGVNWTPATVQGLNLSASYFRVDYRDRIGNPPLLGGDVRAVWLQYDRLSPLFDIAPSLQTVQSYFNSSVIDFTGLGPAGVEAIYDGRIRNIAKTSEAGIDASLAYSRDTAIGSIGGSLNATYLLYNDYQIASTVRAIAINNNVGQPVDLRFRGSASWSRGSWSSSLTVAYWNSYDNLLYTPAQPIDSWVTADLQLAYRFDGAHPAFLRGLSLALSAQNLTDETPPRVNSPVEPHIGFDPTNANVIGRVVSIHLTKVW